MIIANDVSGDALQGLVVNKTKGNLRVCAIKSPGFGASRHDMLHDLVCLTGGTVITDSFDMAAFSIDNFGSCEKILTQRINSMIISKKEKNTQSKLKERIASIKERLNEGYDVSDNEKEILNYRLKQLSGGVAILKIGAATESELIERYDRVDDALHATKAAVAEGILPGGGVALARSIEILEKLALNESNPDIKAGIEIMSRVASMPFKQIIKNGAKSSDNIFSKLLEKNKNVGYDAKNNIFGDMYDIGIVDPHKVVRCALENAVSAAKILLSIGCCMVEINEDD
jgi:chaperonin GroEL